MQYFKLKIHTLISDTKAIFSREKLEDLWRMKKSVVLQT